MSEIELGAIVIAIGSFVFGLGASLPTSRVFQERDPNTRLRIIAGALAQWQLSQLGFALGPTIAAVGLAVVTLGLADTSAMLGYVGVGLILIGVACWDLHVYMRAVDPEAFVHGRIPPWLFVVYNVTTCLGLVSFGAALFFGGFVAWLGALTAAAGLAILVAYLLTKDMVPFVYYLLLGAVAWVLGPAWLGPAWLVGFVVPAVAYFASTRTVREA